MHPAPTLTGSDLAAAMERVVRLVREMSTAGDVSSTAAAVLTTLGRQGPSRVTDLARREGVSQPAMSQLVNRLESEGLVARATDSEDRRGVLVEVSERGRGVIEARRTQRAEILGAALERLDADDQQAIAAALPALGRLVEAVLGG